MKWIRLPRLNAQYVRLALTLATFLIGIYGFHTAYASLPNADRGFAAHGLRALHLVLGKFPPELSGRDLPTALVVARYLLPALSWWTGLRGLWLAVRNDVRLKLLGRSGGHLIVAGDGALAALLVEGERRRGGRAVIVASDTRARWVSDASNRGTAHVAQNDPRLAARLALAKARMIVVVGTSDAGNVELARRLAEGAESSRHAEAPLQILARVDDADLRAQWETRLDRMRQGNSVLLRLVSLPEIEARSLFLEHPLDCVVRAVDPLPRIFILGFSATAERYLLRVLAGAHFRGGGSPQILVLDRRAAERSEAFFGRYPAAAGMNNLAFQTAPVDRPSLLDDVLAGAVAAHGLPSLAMIDVGSDSGSFAAALAVENYFAGVGRAPPRILFRSAANPAADISAWLHAFGSEAAVATPEAFLQEEHDVLARAIHEAYLEERRVKQDRPAGSATVRPWDALTETVRDDNRLAADLYALKLRDIGARILKGNGPSLDLTPQEVESLAEAEHNRWMAAKLLQGWRYGEERNDAARTHPDIKAYAALDEAVKELDREQVRLISRLLQRSGWQALREREVDAADLESNFPTALVRLRDAEPESALVLIGDVQRERTRAGLTAGLRGGFPVRARVTEDVEAWLAELPRTEASQARELLRHADRIEVSAKDQTSAN
jgi:hypothetical protein